MRKAIILLVILFPVIWYFSFRGELLNRQIRKVKSKLESRGAKLVVGEAGFSGLGTILINDIRIIVPGNDTLFLASSISARFSLLQWINGLYPVDKISLQDATINLITDSINPPNYAPLIRENQPDLLMQQEVAGDELKFSRKFESMIDQLIRFTGYEFDIKNLIINWNNNDSLETVVFQHFIYSGHRFNSKFYQTDTPRAQFELRGESNLKDGKISFHLGTENDQSGTIPLVKRLMGIRLFLSRAAGELIFNQAADGSWNITLNGSAVRPGIQHQRIGPYDVLTDSVAIRSRWTLTPHSISTTDTALFILDRIPLLFHFSHKKQQASQFTFSTRFQHVEASDFFGSLPNGLFQTLEGLEAKGKLTYRLDFAVNMNNPDSVLFESSLDADNFSITKFGHTNFRRINEEFIHYPIESDQVVRAVTVGPSNRYFTPIELISPYLINAVLISEDGNFYSHRGFSQNAFRKSIATNLKEKRFARGGSTITMQLVKNAFLNRNKTVARKIEEAIIVWLIENERLVSKQRMLEVYLNMIEWGPGIYGIGEAAEFYFAKHPSELNIPESVYLSAIIPRPKYFRYSFNKDGTIREYLHDYYRIVCNRMVGKEIISQEQMDNTPFTLALNGEARKFILPPDSVPVDSLKQEIQELIYE
jgi:hypothetical protein